MALENVSWPSALYLENGHLFEGTGFGAEAVSGGEIVFNTGMTGYQEILTDPSYSKQVVLFTYPHLGNTGVNDEDMESTRYFPSAVVAREYEWEPSNWRSVRPLHEALRIAGVVGISGVDTRHLTQIVRQEGAQRAVVFPTDGGDLSATGKALLEKIPAMEGLELVSGVSCSNPWTYSEAGSANGRVVVYDYGVKHGILRSLSALGWGVVVVPHNYPAKEVLGLGPRAVVLSNGPGDPAVVKAAVSEIQSLIGKVPLLGICMGHQLLARAMGYATFKLKFGHHGVNHPVRDLRTGEILITSQNHGFAVDSDSLSEGGIELSHVSLNDGTVEGMFSGRDRWLSVQFHPEANPGPRDAQGVFRTFFEGFK